MTLRMAPLLVHTDVCYYTHIATQSRKRLMKHLLLATCIGPSMLPMPAPFLHFVYKASKPE